MKKIVVTTLSIVAALSLISCKPSPATQPNNKPAATSQQNSINEEKAKEIALKHAGLTSDQVSFVKAEKELDDGIEKYDIEFYANNKEYDYEIDATTGEIISYEFD